MEISRTAAQDIIKGGYVQVAGTTVLKPGVSFPKGTTIAIEGSGRIYVGRGGDKLEAALHAFDINVYGQVCLDVGASTGGFTDCLLKRGAAKVYAVENGRNQLASQLIADSRVVSMEETDIRNTTVEWFDESITLAVVDVSFISLTKVLNPIMCVVAPKAEIICLIKPQYEVGKGHISKRGIIKDQPTRQRVLDEVCAFASSLGLDRKGILPFPEPPKKNKNQEFLVHFTVSH